MEELNNRKSSIILKRLFLTNSFSNQQSKGCSWFFFAILLLCLYFAVQLVNDTFWFLKNSTFYKFLKYFISFFFLSKLSTIYILTNRTLIYIYIYISE